MEERNPSPPREFEDDAEKFRQDMVGDTTISKRWIYSILMDMCKEIEKQAENDKEDTIDISDELQDEMCRLWDLCVEEDVACFLADSNYIALLSGIIEGSKSPRLTEITVGILGNMACTTKACETLSKDAKLLPVITSLLSCRDSPTLVEVGRLINTCLADANSKKVWLDYLESNLVNLLEDIIFILSSSTNDTVLRNMLEMVDICIDSSDTLSELCVKKEFVNSAAEAGVQLFKSEDSFIGVITCLHILYLLTTADEKAINSFNSNNNVFDVVSRCFEKWKNLDDFDITEGNPSAIPVASCFSVVSFLLDVSSNSDKSENFMDSITQAQKDDICTITDLVLKSCHSTTTSYNTEISQDDNTNSNGDSKKSESSTEKSKTSAKDQETEASVDEKNNNEPKLFHGIPLLEITEDLKNILERLKWWKR